MRREKNKKLEDGVLMDNA